MLLNAKCLFSIHLSSQALSHKLFDRILPRFKGETTHQSRIGRGWFVLFTAFSYSLISWIYLPFPVFSQVRGGGANFYHSTTYTVAFPVFWAASFLIWFISLWFYLLSIRNLSKSHIFWCLFLSLLALSWIYPLSFWKANVVICQIQKLTAFTLSSKYPVKLN